MTGWTGIPFLDGGRDRAGCDCWGLVRLYIAATAGVALPAYAETPAGDLALAAAAIGEAMADPAWLRIPGARARAGAVVLLYDPAGRALRHVGVLTAPGRLLHVEAATGSVIVALSHPSVRHRIHSFWRHRELA